MNDAERHTDHLAKRRKYYADVLKPRKEAQLEAEHEAKATTLVI